jgi:hypothetical protein
MEKLTNMENNALAQIPTGPLGLENVKTEDLVLSRILIVQDKSYWTKTMHLTAGELVNSLSKKSSPEVSFIPLIVSKYWDLLKREGNRMVFDYRVTREDDPRMVGRHMYPDESQGIKADVNAVIAIAALVNNSPVIIPFSKTSYRTGRNLITLAHSQNEPLFNRRYILKTRLENKNGNEYYVLDYSEQGATTDEERIKCFELYKSLAPKVQNLNAPSMSSEGVEEVPF